ncbi:hypothetical protein [Flavobacterium sp.]|uniref:hypothetical protein n=1 Tax=Flavobacterium sp. TaxID=239 RepID=UPI0031DAA839
MDTNHNRIKVVDLEKNEPNKTLITNENGELVFSEFSNIPDSFFESGTGTKSIIAKNKENNATTGMGAVVLGYYSQASGENSFAEGNGTTASGTYAHAEGTNTTASGDWSHSEGNYTKATSFGSHSQGIGTLSSGFASHSQGEETIASGDHSFAGGHGSNALGECSFAFGYGSNANEAYTIVLGSSITGTQANTTYVDNFNIKTLGNGLSVKNLGIDSNGNIVSGNLQYSDIYGQLEIDASQNILSSWHGKTILFTNNCTITIPASLPDNFIFNGITLPSVNVTWVITAPHTWLFGTPSATTEKQIFTFTKRGNTNSILLLGV